MQCFYNKKDDEIFFSSSAIQKKYGLPVKWELDCFGNRVPFVAGQEFQYLDLPCGRCVECKADLARSWVVRLTLHWQATNIRPLFLTLTYRNNPKTLIKSDLQKFFKRLRKAGFAFKYFACGEYGSHTLRPHYHAILFPERESDRYPLVSAIVNDWTKWHGFADVSSVKDQGALAYVCSYTFKKAYDLDLNVKLIRNGLAPMFQLQSQGLGLPWFEENGERLLDDYRIYLNGQVQSVPRYFDKQLEKAGYDKEVIKKAHREAVAYRKAVTPVLSQKERQAKINAKKSKRIDGKV